MITAIRKRLASERGFTLIELLVSMTIGIVVLMGALTLIDSGGRASTRLADKAETVQRVRIGMDRIVRILRTQTCLDATTPPIASGDANSITFYSDMAYKDDPATTTRDEQTEFRPRKVELTFPASGSGAVVQKTWDTTSATPSPTAPVWTFQTSTSSNRQVLSHVSRVGSTPFLSYSAWNSLTTAAAVPLSQDTNSDTMPINSIAKIVKVNVSLRAGPTSNNADDKRKSSMSSNVYTRNSDLSGQPDPGRTWGPRCA